MELFKGNNMNRLGIAGYGFVGHAFDKAVNMTNEITISDPAKGYLINHNDLVQPQAIVICVSTPQGSHGGCHMDNVYCIIEDNPNVPILIKSTISVEGWKMLQHVFPHTDIAFSPEFLRAAHWETDAQLQDKIYLGGGNTGFWADIFITALGEIDIDIVEPQALVTAKAVRNSFLATKVAFFNEIYDYCRAYNIDYESVAGVVGDDSRITKSHTQITDERGFGGHCFPKDTAALLHTANSYRYNLSILNEAVNYNKGIRNE